jgi:hypothetical protein
VFLSSEPRLPAEVGSGAATYPTAPSGLWTTGIKKGLAAPGMQLGSHVSKARLRVIKPPARRADMPLQFCSTVQRRPSWPLMDMTTVVIHDLTGRHHGTGQVQCSRAIRQDDSMLLTSCKTSLGTPSH